MFLGIFVDYEDRLLDGMGSGVASPQKWKLTHQNSSEICAYLKGISHLLTFLRKKSEYARNINYTHMHGTGYFHPQSTTYV